jgi:hypothetical protein
MTHFSHLTSFFTTYPNIYIFLLARTWPFQRYYSSFFHQKNIFSTLPTRPPSSTIHHPIYYITSSIHHTCSHPHSSPSHRPHRLAIYYSKKSFFATLPLTYHPFIIMIHHPIYYITSSIQNTYSHPHSFPSHRPHRLAIIPKKVILGHPLPYLSPILHHLCIHHTPLIILYLWIFTLSHLSLTNKFLTFLEGLSISASTYIFFKYFHKVLQVLSLGPNLYSYSEFIQKRSFPSFFYYNSHSLYLLNHIFHFLLPKTHFLHKLLHSTILYHHEQQQV